MARGARRSEFKVSVDGARELGLKLESLGEEANAALKAAVKEAAQVAVDYAKAHAPAGSGATRDKIHMWPAVRQKKGASGKALRAVMTSMFVGIRSLRKGAKTSNPYYATFTELGSSEQSPQYYLRDAVDKNKQRISEILVSRMRQYLR
jgi:HK97 gp10 family phage protein